MRQLSARRRAFSDPGYGYERWQLARVPWPAPPEGERRSAAGTLRPGAPPRWCGCERAGARRDDGVATMPPWSRANPAALDRLSAEKYQRQRTGTWPRGPTARTGAVACRQPAAPCACPLGIGRGAGAEYRLISFVLLSRIHYAVIAMSSRRSAFSYCDQASYGIECCEIRASSCCAYWAVSDSEVSVIND